MTKKLVLVKCLQCGREWTPRKPDPKRCPGCGSADWNVPDVPVPPPLPPVEEHKAPEPPVHEETTLDRLEFDPEVAYHSIRDRFKRKPRPERPDLPDKEPRRKISEAKPELYDWAATILPKLPLLTLLLVLMYDALGSMARGDMWFVMDWYNATWVLPHIVAIFLYPGGPGAWFQLFWPLAMLLVALFLSLAFVAYVLPYRFCFKDYVIIRGNVKVKDGRVMWSTDNIWTKLWDRFYGTPPRDTVEMWLKHRFFWNPLMPNKDLVKLTLDRKAEHPEMDGPFTLTAYERRYRMYVALNEMVTTDDGQQTRPIPLDEANEKFRRRGESLVWDAQKFSYANPGVRLEKLRKGTHIVPQELKEAADLARKERHEG